MYLNDLHYLTGSLMILMLPHTMSDTHKNCGNDANDK